MTAKFSESICADDTKAPALGQDNRDVFVGLLGLSEARFAELREAKAVY
jgi:hypothetical protein